MRTIDQLFSIPMNKVLLILDLDGVLITTPTWKADEIDSDGYSKFSRNCVSNLNRLLATANFEIWLSSHAELSSLLMSLTKFLRIA